MREGERFPAVYLQCSMFAEDAIKAAFSDLEAKHAAQTQVALGVKGKKFAAAVAR